MIPFKFRVPSDLFSGTLRKIQQHERHVEASHWNPCKLTHFNRYLLRYSQWNPIRLTHSNMYLLGYQWLGLTCRSCCKMLLVWCRVFQQCSLPLEGQGSPDLQTQPTGSQVGSVNGFCRFTSSQVLWVRSPALKDIWYDLYQGVSTADDLPEKLRTYILTRQFDSVNNEK